MNLVEKWISPEEILSLFQAKKIDPKWSLSEYKTRDTNKWTHGYHRYPAKFIPQLVEQLFDEYIQKPSAWVHDPFFGSGTTIVSGIARGFTVSGTDIHTMAYLISKVKSTPIDPYYLYETITNFLRQLKNSHSAGSETIIPKKHKDKIDFWFSESNQKKIARILGLIYKEQNRNVRDFLLVALSHILKNSSIWLSSSTKPTRDFNKIPSDPYIVLERHLNKMQKGNAEFYSIIPKEIQNYIDQYLLIRPGDAKKTWIHDSSIDLIVSSSPYVTSYEYADLHQLSIFWLDLGKTLKEYRQNFIGTIHKPYIERTLKSQIAKNVVQNMYEKSSSLAKAIANFFFDMQEVFDENFRILKKGGRVCYVIGNTRLKNVDILNAEIFMESLQISGFTMERLIKREIPLKILPQKRDKKTGRFSKSHQADTEAYPTEYILVGRKTRL